MRGLAASARFRVRGEPTTRSATVFRRGKSDNRLGIYMPGVSDLPTVFAAKPFIEQDLDGVCAIMRDGEAADVCPISCSKRPTVLTPTRWPRRANTSSCPRCLRTPPVQARVPGPSSRFARQLPQDSGCALHRCRPEPSPLSQQRAWLPCGPRWLVADHADGRGDGAPRPGYMDAGELHRSGQDPGRGLPPQHGPNRHRGKARGTGAHSWCSTP